MNAADTVIASEIATRSRVRYFIVFMLFAVTYLPWATSSASR